MWEVGCVAPLELNLCPCSVAAWMGRAVRECKCFGELMSRRIVAYVGLTPLRFVRHQPSAWGERLCFPHVAGSHGHRCSVDVNSHRRGWGERTVTVVSMQTPQFILVLGFLCYCIIFYTNNYRPAFVLPCMQNT